MYLRGDQDFCSIAQNRELSSIGNVRVPPRDARSVAVPIVPKRVGETEIEVSLIVQIKHGGSFRNAAGDIVIKKLLVVVGILVYNLNWAKAEISVFLTFSFGWCSIVVNLHTLQVQFMQRTKHNEKVWCT